MRMKRRLTAAAVVVSLISVFVLAPAAASAAPATPATPSTSHTASAAASTATNPFTNIPVSGTLDNGGTFTGTLTVTHFASQNKHLVANGLLSGTLTDAVGHTIGTVTDVPVTLPVVRADPTCPILALTLGPLDLNLLGLVVHLSQVHLTITAESGSGNLLGNLLCAVAHLLDNTGATSASSGLANLLNRILAILNGL